MNQELKSLLRMEARKLLWLMGVIFATIFVVQYLELPYGNMLVSLVSFNKVPPERKTTFRMENTSLVDEMAGNPAVPRKSNSIREVASDDKPNMTSVSEAKDKNKNIVFSGIQMGLNNASGKAFVEAELNSTMKSMRDADMAFAPEQARNPEPSNDLVNDTYWNLALSNMTKENIAPMPQHESKSSFRDSSALSTETSTAILSFPPSYPPIEGSNVTILKLFIDTNVSSVEKDVKKSSYTEPGSGSGSLKTNVTSEKNSSDAPIKEGNRRPQTQSLEAATLTLSDMNNLLLQSRTSCCVMKPRWTSAVDQELLDARSQIENAPIVNNYPQLYAPLYRNVSMFKRSYELMEGTLKVYIYREGRRPILHTPFLKGLYASEGWFMKLMEADNRFVTKDPTKAHLFYLPFSSRMLEETLYVANSHSHKNLVAFLKDYLGIISQNYPFWNRTAGADHFLVACHDWAPAETRSLMANCIRALCNSDVKEGFVFGKDVSLPETYVRSDRNPDKYVGGKAPSKRSVLAFFAGSMHGYLRSILLKHWENKDPDMKIFGRLPKSKGDRNYIEYMKSSKFCICAKGYEVNSPRVVEAILYECVPVIISDNFVPPFFEVLNWESFAVFVMEKDIPNLKNILQSIPERRFRQMQLRVKRVQKHFIWHTTPMKYDIFHMILHSIWYNRVFNARTR